MARFVPDPDERAKLVAWVKALGATDKERAERLWYGTKRVEQFRAGHVPVAVLKFIQAGIVSVNPVPEPPADVAGK